MKLSFVSESIEKYAEQHSTGVSSDCQKIEALTRASVPMSVMLCGGLEASFLSFLVRLVRARRVLEFGCFTGYSALAMAEALPDDGEVVTLEYSAENLAIAKKNWANTQAGHKIRAIAGPAGDTMGSLTGPFDLVFIDADKPSYPAYLKRSLELLSPQGVILVDNTLYQGQVLETSPREANAIALKRFNADVVANQDLIVCLLPIRDGITLIQKR